MPDERAQQYQTMADALLNEPRLLLVGHQDPDCDCLGSLLGLYHAFAGAERDWVLLRRDPAPANLDFLPGLELMRQPDAVDINSYPAILLVDCGEIARCGDWLQPHLHGQRLYCIDHHQSNDFHGDLAVVEPGAAAAAELVLAICEQAELSLNDDAALCLYSALVADTGCFRYNNTTSRCLTQAGQLRPQVPLELVRIRLFENRSLPNIRLMGVCCDHLRTECNGLLAYSWLSREDMRQHQALSADCHNIVNYTLALAGVKVGILFEEYDGYVKLSLRSRQGWRVDGLAVALGGGGHQLAAGARVDGTLEQVIPLVVSQARQLLAQKS